MTIAYQCPDCRQQLKTSTGQVGKRTRCPECGASFHVPEADAWDTAGLNDIRPNSFSTQPIVRPEMGSMDEYERRLREERVRRQSAALKLLLAVGIPLLLILLAVFLWLALKRRPEQTPAELELVPDDAAIFVSVDVAKIWQGRTINRVREQYPQAVQNIDALVRDYSALDPNNVSRLIVVVRDWPQQMPAPGNEPSNWLLVTTKQPYDQIKLRQKMGRDAKTRTIAGKPCLLVSKHDREGLVHFFNQRTIVLTSDESEMAAFFRHAAELVDGRPLSRPLLLASQKAVVVGMQTPKGGVPKLNQPAPAMMNGPGGDLRSGTLSLDEVGEKVELAIELQYGNQADAQNTVQNIEQVLGLGKIAVALKKGQENDEDKRGLFTLAEEFLDSVKVKASGPAVTMQGNVNLSDKLRTIVKVLQTIDIKGQLPDLKGKR